MKFLWLPIIFSMLWCCTKLDSDINLPVEEINPKASQESSLLCPFPARSPRFYYEDCEKLMGLERERCAQIALLNYICHHFHYPPELAENCVEGLIVVQMVVDKNGYPISLQIRKSLYKNLDDELLRVLGTIPKWLVASEGQMNYNLQLPFRIKLE